MIALSVLSKMWSLTWLRWAVAGAGMLAVCAFGVQVLRNESYSDGFREGKKVTQAQWDADATLARTVAARITAHRDSLTAALRDTMQAQDALIAHLREASARASGRYAEALRFYEEAKALAGDSLPDDPVARACDAVATACTLALSAAQMEKDALVSRLRTAEAAAVAQTDYEAKEQQRWKPVILDALSEQRRSFHAPSRTQWFGAGMAIGAATGRASCGRL